jgi:hypothetical protein
MPGVRTQHKAYKASLPVWQRCRDAAAGQDAIRAAGETYLPRLADQDSAAYTSYLTRANWFNATSRTIEGLKGMLFRKPEQVDVPEGILPLLDDVTMGGEPLHLFAQQIAQEVLTVGRVGLLVDHPSAPVDSAPLTIARAQQLGMRPKLAQYCAESIWNWKCERINNVHQLTMVVLHEDAQVPGDDEFDVKTEDRWRVLDLQLTTQGPVYRQRLFKVDKQTDKDVLLEVVYPQLDGKFLTAIPFTFIGVEGLHADPEIPPLVDLVDVNLSHFRVSADYEHGCHFTGLPTPYIAGYFADTDAKLHVGSLTAWVFQSENTKVGYLEFTGQGLSCLVENMVAKKDMMAILGARLLTTDSGSNQTAMTAAIHHGGETSILGAIAQTISLGLQRQLTLFCAWAGQAADVVYQVNQEFYPFPVDAPTLTAVVAAWQQGAISDETKFDYLQQREVIGPEVTFEEEQQRLAKQQAERDAREQAKAQANAALQVATANQMPDKVPPK